MYGTSYPVLPQLCLVSMLESRSGGNRKTYNEIMKLAEDSEVRGKRLRLCSEREAWLIGFAGKSFEVRYLSEEQLMKTIAE